MRTVFLFDESFEGLLCAIFDAYTGKRFPDDLLGMDASLPLLATHVHRVETVGDKASRVFKGLCERLSRQSLRDLMAAWLAEDPDAALPVFTYVRKTFDARRSIEHDLADPDVFTVTRLARQVWRERHQLEGFVRFQECADATLFAYIRPRHNVLPLLLTHFADRLSDERWMLYDAGRRYGVLHDKGRFHDLHLKPTMASTLAVDDGRLLEAALSENEALCAALWQTYFNATAVKDRINPRLQRRCVPARFWAFMTEKQPQHRPRPYRAP